MRRLVAASVLLAIGTTVASAQQTAGTPVGALQVYDSQGKVVGRFIPGEPNEMAAIIGPSWAALVPVNRSGFTLAVRYAISAPTFMHTTADCSGPRLLFGNPDTFLPPPAIASAGKLIVPLGPALPNVPFNSREEFPAFTKDFTRPGTCVQVSGSDPAYVLVTVDANAVGIPPFTIR